MFSQINYMILTTHLVHLNEWHVTACVCVSVLVGSHLTTEVFIGNLLAVGRGWVLISGIVNDAGQLPINQLLGCTQPCISCTPINVIMTCYNSEMCAYMCVVVCECMCILPYLPLDNTVHIVCMLTASLSLTVALVYKS